MIDNHAPAVKKINKTAVAIVVVILLGGYLIFGFKNIGKKHDFKELGYKEDQFNETELDAPQFVQGRTYSEINYMAVPSPVAIEGNDGIDAKPAIIPAVYHDNNSIDEGPLDVIPAPDIRPKPKRGNVSHVYSGGIDSQIAHGGGVAVDDESIKNNSPSGWGGGANASYGGDKIPQSFDYAAPDLNLPNTERLLATLTDQGPRNSRKEFMDSVSSHEDVYLQETIEKPKSPYQVMAGSVIPCTMVSGINSDLPGDIIAQVRGPVYDSIAGNYLLIPHGTKFIGSYDSGVVFGQQRCLFAWKRMIFPNGRSIQLRGMTGADLAGYSGIKDSVDYHYMRLTGAILMSSFLAIGTERLDNGSTFRSQMAQDINKSGQKIVDMQLNVQPTLKVAPATPFNIMVNKDIVLKPYKG